MSEGPPRIFDRKALALHRTRARKTDGDAFLAQAAAEGLAERIGAVQRTFDSGYAIDTLDAAMSALEGCARHWTHTTVGPDEALSPVHEDQDLAVSVLSLHAVNDLPGILVQARRALKPDGLFVAALFGGETLAELRQSLAAAELEVRGGVSPRVAPFGDVRDLGGLLQRAGFALPVADVERTIVRYKDFMSLVRDLRAMGETNVLVERSGRPISRTMLTAMLAHYAANFADPDGRLRATFDIVYLTGWAPHESQQQPLRPGSAKARLAEALGTEERGAGDIATGFKHSP
jgi:SAM-dependent methyltransferase